MHRRSRPYSRNTELLSKQILSEDQKEALQEIANIGMGQAGSSIAQLLDHFVQLSIPRILTLQPDDIASALLKTVGPGNVSAVRQAFHSILRGEAVVIFGEQRCSDLADLMGYEPSIDHASELELLLDVSNILVGACLSGIAEQMKAEIGFSAPSLIADQIPVEELLPAGSMDWRNALLVEVNFRLEQRSFACHLVILMIEGDIKSLVDSLDRFLAAY